MKHNMHLASPKDTHVVRNSLVRVVWDAVGRAEEKKKKAKLQEFTSYQIVQNVKMLSTCS